jgi:hypothetical protein
LSRVERRCVIAISFRDAIITVDESTNIMTTLMGKSDVYELTSVHVVFKLNLTKNEKENKKQPRRRRTRRRLMKQLTVKDSNRMHEHIASID